jgi:hypothetical protein
MLKIEAKELRRSIDQGSREISTDAQPRENEAKKG